MTNNIFLFKNNHIFQKQKIVRKIVLFYIFKKSL